MKGRYHIIVQSSHLKYEFDIIRNITIIKGDSATGKTTLAELIREYTLNGTDTGITISCDVPCRLLEGNTWAEQLSLISNSIVFIDEGNSFVSSNEFASAIKGSSNYYVIITRESLHSLPYSVTEIYGIHSSGKYNSLEPVYHELYKIYSSEKATSSKPDTVIVEDSNSGYEFFDTLFKNTKCISAKGRDNIFSLLTDGNITGNILVIADGAAFGAPMSNIHSFVENKDNISLYLPESFEWLILDSSLLDNSDVRKILSAPEDHIDSENYFSWERYFTHLLIEKTEDSYLKYTKAKLNPAYLHEKSLNAISQKLPKLLLDLI